MVKIKKGYKHQIENGLKITVYYTTMDLEWQTNVSCFIPEKYIHTQEFINFIAVLYSVRDVKDNTKGNVNVCAGYYYVPKFSKYFDSNGFEDIEYDSSDYDSDSPFIECLEYPPAGQCYGWEIEYIKYTYFKDGEYYNATLEFTDDENNIITEWINKSRVNQLKKECDWSSTDSHEDEDEDDKNKKENEEK